MATIQIRIRITSGKQLVFFVFTNYINHGPALVRKLWFPLTTANWGIR